MLIFVKMQNWIKWQTDSCSSVQNNQNPANKTGGCDNHSDGQLIKAGTGTLQDPQ